MRFKKLDLNLLVALDALLVECSISRAAEKLHLGQSAMSSALARLREYFDDELLVQVGRRMEPTSKALALKDPVRDVLVRVEAAVLTQPEFDPAESDREFRLTVSDYTNAVLMPHLMALVQQQSGGVRFQLLPQVQNPQRALERGDVDLMIIPQRFSSPEHPSEVLYNESFCCLVWEHSPLVMEELTLQKYLEHGHVAMWQAYETSALAELGIHRRVEVTTFSFATVPGLVVSTSRIATIHERLAILAQRWLPVVSKPLPVSIPPMQQTIQWHKYRTKDPGLAWLRQTLKAAVVRMNESQRSALR